MNHKTNPNPNRVHNARQILLSLMMVGLVMLQVSCNSGQLYKRAITLPDSVWNSGDRVRFVIPVNKPPEKAALHLFFRYATAFQYNSLQVKCTIFSPDNSILVEDTMDLPFRTEEGEVEGVGFANVWDIDFVLLKSTDIFSKKGHYTIEIAHAMPEKQVFFIGEVGLLLERVE